MQLSKKIGLILTGLIIAATVMTGQVRSLESEYYSVNDGLSERQINDLLLSQYGMVWLATDRGLNRFDGYNFKVFTADQTNLDSTAISANRIEQIVENKEGKIYIVYKNNISFFDIFDPLSHQSKQIPLHPERGLKGVPKVLSFNSDGEIFILTSSEIFDNIYTFDVTTSSFKLVARLKGIKSQQEKGGTKQMLPTINGFFFINDSNEGLKLYDSGGNVLKKFESSGFNPGNGSFLYPRHTYFMHQDKQARIWLSFSNNPGVYIFNPVDLEFNLVGQLPDGKYFTRLWEDQRGNVLLAQTASAGNLPTTEKLFCINTEGDVIDFSHLIAASNNIISCSAKDFFNTVFFGIDTGFKIIRNSQTKVKTWLAKNLDQDRRGIIMRGITSDNRDYVYFANEMDQWYALDLETDVLDTLLLNDFYTGKTIRFSFANNLIYHNGFLWGGGLQDDNGLLLKYDVENCTTQTYDYPDPVKSVMIDSSGLIWMGCQDKDGKGSLINFLPDEERFVDFLDDEGKNPFIENYPRFMIQARDKSLWIGTNQGLYHLETSGKVLEIINSKPSEGQPSLNNDVVLVIHEDDRGKVWVGTQKGLNILDQDKKTVEFFTKEDALASDIVCGIIPDDQGNYWISTFNGLSYFDTSEKSFRSFFGADGFSNDEFNLFSFYKDYKGRYYLGGVNGMNAFYPKDLLVEKEIPKPVLTKVTRYNSWEDSLYTLDANLYELKA